MVCSCGHDINHPNISYETEYSKWGWFLLTVLGLSAKPKQVNHFCKDCNEIVKTSNEPEILKKYVGR